MAAHVDADRQVGQPRCTHDPPAQAEPSGRAVSLWRERQRRGSGPRHRRWRSRCYRRRRTRRPRRGSPDVLQFSHRVWFLSSCIVHRFDSTPSAGRASKCLTSEQACAKAPASRSKDRSRPGHDLPILAAAEVTTGRQAGRLGGGGLQRCAMNYRQLRLRALVTRCPTTDVAGPIELATEHACVDAGLGALHPPEAVVPGRNRQGLDSRGRLMTGRNLRFSLMVSAGLCSMPAIERHRTHRFRCGARNRPPPPPCR